jgi:adenylylsulfate kinase
MEKVSRSVAKSVTFRIIIVVADGIIVYAFTRKLDLALGIVVVRNAIAMVLYIVHERAWNKVRWGVKKQVSL